MKKKLCLLFVLVLIFAGIIQSSVLASNIMPLNNNTNLTKTRFLISDSGEAIVSLRYEGYPNVTTGAIISIKIEKRNLLFFWKDVIDETIIVNDIHYYEELHYQLDKRGTYKCTVEYVISGTGADDVITYEAEEKY